MRAPWKIVAVAGALAVVVSVAVLLLRDGADAPPDAAPTPETTAQPSFGFVLDTWRCRHTVIRTATEVLAARGEFCVVQLDVENRGEAPASLEQSCQFLIDDGGRRFTPRPDAMALDPVALEGFGGEIQPGGVVDQTALIFDVPKRTEPVAVELHETCDGPGVEFPL